MVFRRAVVVAPALGEAFAGLGEALVAAGLPVEGGAAYARAVAVDPDGWSWRLELGAALSACGKAGAAADEFRAVLARRPDIGAARRGLARALAATGATEQAMAEYREVLALDRTDSQAFGELAALLLDTGDPLAAVELLLPALRRDDDEPALHLQLGRAWMALSEPAKARAAFERASDLDPEGVLGAAGWLEALDRGAADTLSTAYVRALFDGYADRFDGHLQRLGYAAPALIEDAVRRTGGGAGLAILDLGCGTGLAGMALRSFAARMEGIDLSPRMVERAKARGCYDAVRVDEAVAALAGPDGTWDLVVAADVLVYIGDLAPLLAAAVLALRPGGRLVATVERAADAADAANAAGFALGPTRRYAHGAAYLREAAAAAGLDLVLLDECVPRRERQAPVPGLLFVMKRPHTL
jgi:predicted TPR repeat methyltransferase